jgi:hypothetical protein
MAKLLNPFDANQYKPATIGVPKLPVSGPEGHLVVIVGNEIRPTKDNEGGMLALTLQIIDGEFKGSTGEWLLNLYNKSETAQRIAYEQLTSVSHVTGVFQILDADVLMNIPFRVVVALQAGENKEGYTTIKGVKDVNGNDPGKQNQGQQQHQQQPNQQFQGQQGVQNQQQQPVQGANTNWNNNTAQQPVNQPVNQQQQPVNNGGWNNQGQQQHQQQPVQNQQQAAGGPSWANNR